MNSDRAQRPIPKCLHIVWVGDETKRPDNCIATWRRRHPHWTIKIWGNEALAATPWVNRRHIDEMAKKELCGVADLMRWEILAREGGVAIDADSVCLRALDEWLLEAESFACWESELARPGLISTAVLATVPNNQFFERIVQDLSCTPSVVHDEAWKTTGPAMLTASFHRYQCQNLTIYPSHFFIPEHFTGVRYQGSGLVYARQHWGSTCQRYDALHQQAVDHS